MSGSVIATNLLGRTVTFLKRDYDRPDKLLARIAGSLGGKAGEVVGVYRDEEGNTVYMIARDDTGEIFEVYANAFKMGNPKEPTR